MDRTSEGILVEEVGFEACQTQRDAWGLFRDRRPENFVNTFPEKKTQND